LNIHTRPTTNNVIESACVLYMMEHQHQPKLTDDWISYALYTKQFGDYRISCFMGWDVLKMKNRKMQDQILQLILEQTTKNTNAS